MNIYINGKLQNVAQDCTAQTLIESLNLQDVKIAMEVNREIVPRGEYKDYVFNEDDKVEIVRAIGGG